MRLIVIRHGTAEPHDARSNDDARELTRLGREEAAYLGAEFRDRAWYPEVLLTSPAVRARETARILNEALQVPLEFEPRLGTDRSARDVYEVIEERAGQGVDHLAVTGHNPTLEEVVTELLGDGEGKPRALEKGMAVVMAFDHAVRRGAGHLVEVLWMGK